MNRTRIEAHAKINLSLEVFGLRPDGYHELRSVVAPIALADGLELTESDETTSDSGYPDDLAVKAVRVLSRSCGVSRGVRIHMDKHIPAGGGLGGGSADAAAVLRALNRHYDAPLSIMALAELGAEVGSDVPFCVLGGTAMVEGRGERIRRLPNMPDCVFVICKPEFSVSTPELYQKIDTVAIADRPDNRAMEAAILAGDLAKVAENVCNVFDPVVTSDHLELNYIKSVCHSYGALAQQMTGSGSAIFAIMDSFEYAAVVCNMLKENYPRVFIGKPVSF